MRLCALLCVVLTESFHTPQNTARRRTRLRAETELSPYEVLGVRTSAKPDEIRKNKSVIEAYLGSSEAG